MRTAVGFAAFVAVFTSAGFGVLAPFVRLNRREVVLFAPLAYVAGIAATGTLLTVAVVLSVPLRLGTVLVAGSIVLASGLIAARRPRTRLAWRHERRSRFEWAITATAIVGVVVVLESAFRAARLEGLFGWDAGSFWVPKAEALALTGGLDERHFTTLPGPSYPPLVPVLQASAFAFLGDVDPARLHLVYWTILAGATLGAAAILSRYASPALAWTAVLLVAGAGEVVAHALVPQGDFLMDVFLAFALVFVVVFVRERRWEAAALALPFATAAVLTKREALLYIGAMALALAIATARRWRETWPWAAMLAGMAVAVLVPWRLWTRSHSLPGPGPEAGGLGLLDHLDRLGPTLDLVLTTLFWPPSWSLVMVAVVGAVCASIIAGREEGLLLGSFLALTIGAFLWVLWALPSVPLTRNASLNPVVRMCGAALVPCALCIPLLAQPILEPLRRRLAPGGMRAAAATGGAVLAAALAYPAIVLAVDGIPRFPSRNECSDRIATATPPFEVIYARTSSYRQARAIHERVVMLGFVDAQLLADGCGRWKVANLDVDTPEQLRGHLQDARRVGYDPWIERA